MPTIYHIDNENYRRELETYGGQNGELFCPEMVSQIDIMQDGAVEVCIAQAGNVILPCIQAMLEACRSTIHWSLLSNQNSSCTFNSLRFVDIKPEFTLQSLNCLIANTTIATNYGAGDALISLADGNKFVQFGILNRSFWIGIIDNTIRTVYNCKAELMNLISLEWTNNMFLQTTSQFHACMVCPVRACGVMLRPITDLDAGIMGSYPNGSYVISYNTESYQCLQSILGSLNQNIKSGITNFTCTVLTNQAKQVYCGLQIFDINPINSNTFCLVIEHIKSGVNCILDIIKYCNPMFYSYLESSTVRCFSVPAGFENTPGLLSCVQKSVLIQNVRHFELSLSNSFISTDIIHGMTTTTIMPNITTIATDAEQYYNTLCSMGINNKAYLERFMHLINETDADIAASLFEFFCFQESPIETATAVINLLPMYVSLPIAVILICLMIAMGFDLRKRDGIIRGRILGKRRKDARARAALGNTALQQLNVGGYGTTTSVI